MYKILKKLGPVFMSAVVCAGFVACNDDDVSGVSL